ncbi:MAG: FHA domain-containing protein [Candidatus Saccharimonadales bacterium]
MSELPPADEHNAGMIAVVDMGCWGQYKGNVDPDEHETLERDFTSLIIVDLNHGKGDLWLDGADIPPGARLAVIDAKRLDLHRSSDEDGEKVTVNNGVMFISAGETKEVGRNHTSSGLDISEASTVSREHMAISVDEDGSVLLRDMGSKFQTIVSTGEDARKAVMELEDRHEHASRFREILGEEVVSNLVEVTDSTPPRSLFGYEHFFDPKARSDEEKAREAMWRKRETEPRPPRYERLFKPFLRPARETKGGVDYDTIFDDLLKGTAKKQDPENITFPKPDLIEREQQEYDKHVTPEAKAAAVSKLIKAMGSDIVLKDILEKYTPHANIHEQVDALREDPNLRYAVGMYFLDKLNYLVGEDFHTFGRRIYKNEDKQPDSRQFLPLKDMKSREYAAYLALAMIDGSFNPSKVTSIDVIARNSNYELIGQHRHAALRILEGRYAEHYVQSVA